MWITLLTVVLAFLPACTAETSSPKTAGGESRPPAGDVSVEQQPVPERGKQGLEVSITAPEVVEAGQRFEITYQVSDVEGEIRGVLVDWGDGKTSGGLPTDLVCDSVAGEAKPTEPSSSEKESLPHAFRRASTYKIEVSAYSGGCFTPYDRIAAHVDIRVTGEDDHSNGPLPPRAKIGHAYYIDGDPSVLVSDIGGFDEDGFVYRIKIDWGDGSTKTIDQPIEFCDAVAGGYPGGWFSAPMEHRYREQGRFLVNVKVTSVACDGEDHQTDRAQRMLRFPPTQGS
jgi:hypothetical protein